MCILLFSFPERSSVKNIFAYNHTNTSIHQKSPTVKCFCVFPADFSAGLRLNPETQKKGDVKNSFGIFLHPHRHFLGL
ncbi:MAG TPA: hypothetical protein DEV98_07890 [Clostridiales bacterium]|nr:hypothetical protein [Clostridiales bacterium]